MKEEEEWEKQFELSEWEKQFVRELICRADKFNGVAIEKVQLVSKIADRILEIRKERLLRRIKDEIREETKNIKCDEEEVD